MEKFQSLADFLGVGDPQADVPAESVITPPNSPQKLTVKSFCRGILDSVQYRESLYRRIVVDELPAAIELMLYDRAYGKTIDRVEVKDTTSIEAMSVEQLEERALALVALARRMRKQRDSQNISEENDSMPQSEGIH